MTAPIDRDAYEPWQDIVGRFLTWIATAGWLIGIPLLLLWRFVP